MLTYLSVPYSEKEDAKKLGARWDPKKQLWFSINGEKELLDRWPLNDIPIVTLIGEDRTFGGNTLFVDLVPASCWFTNVRKCVQSSDWDRLRRFIYERANYKCECCNAKTQLEAHERWHFDEINKVQKLMRIIALCSSCHETTHMGLAQIKGRGDIALKHLMMVTCIDEQEGKNKVDESFKLWRERNKFDWSLDLSIITNSGINLSKAFNKTERRHFSENETSYIRGFENNRDGHSEIIVNATVEPKEVNFIPLEKSTSTNLMTDELLSINSMFHANEPIIIDDFNKDIPINCSTKNNIGFINKIKKFINNIFTI